MPTSSYASSVVTVFVEATQPLVFYSDNYPTAYSAPPSGLTLSPIIINASNVITSVIISSTNTSSPRVLVIK